MFNKLMKIRFTIAAVILLLAFSFSMAPAAEYLGPEPLQPQLSSDGNTLDNAIPAVVYLADPNPPANQVNLPERVNLLALPEQATATFSITYATSGSTDPWGATCDTFPESAKDAFNAAAAVWANLLQSTVPITISACWSNLGSSSVLGYSGGGTSYRNFSGAPLTNTWYSSALANALHGSVINSSKIDMYITYNTNFNWYYGTDGATPSGQYDLMSVVLHEIAHGLNFTGSMAYSSGTGSWGSSGYPKIYDTFMRDGSANPGNLLIDTGVYANPSTELGTALTSQSVWFHGTNAMAANGGNRVKIYAPSTWKSGSSYSHLDYTTFVGTANRLMVYAISSGISTHDPGPVALGILQDMGWPTPDTTPDAFTFTAQTGVALNTVITSNTITVSGINTATPVSITGGTYSINGGTYTNESGTVNNGNTVTVQLTSSASYSTTTNATLTIGGVSDTFSVTTLVTEYLYGFFTGAGISKWDGSSWSQLTTYDPQIITAAGSNLYAAYTGYGISKWDGSSWSQLTPYYPQMMTAAGSNLYAAFTGYGISKWDGSSWSQLTPYDPQMMTAAGSNLYAAYTGYGISKWDGESWSQLTPYYPQMMTAAGSNLYAAYTGYGISKWDGSSWSQLTPYDPQIMTAAGSNLYAAFTGYGISKWDGESWSQLTPYDPQIMTAAGSNLYAAFTGYGISKWDGSSWTQLTPNEPASMVTGN